MTILSASGDELKAREAQAGAVRASFEAAGFEPVTIPVLQPAEIFLDRSGEDIRRRTYLFQDPGGQELCLRPELTIPVCRHYVAAEPAGKSVARLCASGPVYRYQPQGSAKLSEFNQCGLEILGPADEVASDVEMTSLGITAVEAAGVTDYELEFGDLALFGELVDALAIPDARKGRLKRQFWRPAFFDSLLSDLSASEADTDKPDRQDGLLSVLAGLKEDQATALLQDVLKLSGINAVGGRGIDEIASRLLEKAADRTTERMPDEATALLANYIRVSCPASSALARIHDLVQAGGVSVDRGLGRLEKRLAALAKAGINLDKAVFSTGFGRKIEYYTGHVFELRVPRLGVDAVVAGGGRYDGLLQTLGASAPVQAVGCAIVLERLFLATSGQTTSNKGAK